MSELLGGATLTADGGDGDVYRVSINKMDLHIPEHNAYMADHCGRFNFCLWGRNCEVVGILDLVTGEQWALNRQPPFRLRLQPQPIVRLPVKPRLRRGKRVRFGLGRRVRA